MEMSFRWYGSDDPVTLDHIKQIPGMKGIVSAIYDLPVGEVWPYEKIINLKQSIEAKGLRLNVIESVPVHEDIKLGRDTRDHWIENYKKTLINLAKAEIRTVCYNFMPVFDWTRSELQASLPDGSNSLLYNEEKVVNIDPISGELELPGWDLSYQTSDLRQIIEEYQKVSEEQLMENLIYFLERVIPAAEAEDVLMAIHPDDPPWGIFGLPRIMTSKENIVYMLKQVDSRHNGITFCTGSYGANPDNNLLEMLEAAEGRIHFVHARNVKWLGERSFQETSHLASDGSINLPVILRKLSQLGFEGPIRPDHGRMIWGEEGRPGYGLYDRALGAAYINGIIDLLHVQKED
ncbi:mannonate dehydratase [Halobacillus sp. Marseille-Q1614]|uniref:mannonate dehydratase n=1 Tax=Halobacillus sp. Marseille-Q1614 TaxID=2709134 RepID=UPI0015710492|nr:mannonate dehydratase [Halobacillus sp. Marseille-Q1614]